jgi:hypothetical protein
MMVIAVKLWHLGYMMMMLARDVIDLLKHTFLVQVVIHVDVHIWYMFG